MFHFTSMPLESALPNQPPQSPQQQVDPPLSKSGIFKGLLWAGGTLLLTILGNIMTRWLDLLWPNSTWNNIFVSSHIDFSWLPPSYIMIASLIVGYIAHLFVQRAQQDADKRINAKQRELNKGNDYDSILHARDECYQQNNELRDALGRAALKAENERKRADDMQKAFDELAKKFQNYELEKLIKPLYLAFDKYPSTPKQDRGSFNYNGLVHQLSMTPHDWDTLKGKKDAELVKTVDLVIDKMLQHWEIAQSPQLRELLVQYLEIRRNYKKMDHKELGEYYVSAEKMIEEIADLIKTRYNELTDMNEELGSSSHHASTE